MHNNKFSHMLSHNTSNTARVTQRSHKVLLRWPMEWRLPSPCDLSLALLRPHQHLRGVALSPSRDAAIILASAAGSGWGAVRVPISHQGTRQNLDSHHVFFWTGFFLRSKLQNRNTRSFKLKRVKSRRTARARYACSVLITNTAARHHVIACASERCDFVVARTRVSRAVPAGEHAISLFYHTFVC